MSPQFARSESNQLLRLLTPNDRRAVLKASTPVVLSLGQVLCESDESIQYVYFPTSGYISTLTAGTASNAVEVGLVGKEGVFGGTLVLGIDSSPLRALVQGAGAALRMSARRFRALVAAHSSLDRVVRSFVFVQLTQITQTAACGRFHALDARLARWLLMTHDRAGQDTFPFTHQFLSHMLGVRRAGVTEAAGKIQARKFIYYRRGAVQILNRGGLESVACACYDEQNNAYAQHVLKAPRRRRKK